jgi:transcriptional regulator with PAS, ATPase and Fis domain
MQRLLKLVHRVAVTDSTILITGESGVGKERIARLIHDASPRAEGPYIAVNCGAISESLLESELFGHASGSFTGATHGRVGLFEAANHGTLLLDEISEIPLEMQVKLLRVIQEREVRRVGENHNRHIDVRILAATNGDLAREVACGNFRRDLYYRLNVVDLHMPPLRDRQADILPLAQHLLACAAQRLNRDIKGLAPDAADRLLNYGWPGNVRELENAMERAAVFAAGPRVQCEDLPAEIRSAIHPMARNVDGGMPTLKDVERQYILTTLETNNGNQRQTAQDLQIGSATLYRKLKQYGASANFGNQNGNWPASYQESQ